ncbi:MAG: hypothetical protein M0R16_08815 [Bacteroidales bacterium]|jgi:uncharacterized protein YxjI|nr:hypothetical protein [Bacteroidales bacterium]
MKYIISQKTWAISNKFIIKDEQENECFIVNSKLFTFMNQLHLEDLQRRDIL